MSNRIYFLFTGIVSRARRAIARLDKILEMPREQLHDLLEDTTTTQSQSEKRAFNDTSS